ncbi:site-specific DNA-methyltransferase [Campylobacter lari]|nr:site-specific DNA-methyltransferase [Campylobacter lari]
MIDIKDVKKENIINTKENKNELLEYLKANFPQTISDNVPNLNAIMQLLGLNTKAQGYELTFTGKALANALYSTPNTKELKFHSHLSKDSKNTKNVIIKGDNLDALKLLKSAYYEKIKMIYIDPPYNTKNDNFIYKDDFVKEHKKLLMEVGLLEITEEGEEIRSEILNFFINAKGDRSHSAWLGFMLPRLKLARDLLKEDGVIFISIDDNEQANLKILCDEIFGEENFVGDLIWNNKYTTSNDTDISYQHEHILIYSKDRNNFKLGLLPRTEKQNKDYKNRDNDPKGAWKPTPIHARSGSTSNLYKVTFPNGIEWEAPIGRYPRYSKETLLQLYKNGELYFNSNGGIDKKTYLNEVRQGITCGTMWSYDEVGHTHGNNEEIAEILGKGIFSDPKGTLLLKRIIQLSTNPNQNDIVLDFFAGSGTTAQAVMELNAEDNGNRKFILVQLDEKIDEKKSKVAYDFCKNELGNENPVISDITIERVKRAGEKILKENVDKNLDLGFKVFSMVEKPELIKDELNTLNLKYHEHLTPYEKALNLALLDGKTLDKDLKMILKDKLYSCQDCFYIVNCDDEVLEFLRKTQNENVYINGYDDMNLEDYLNLESFLKERLKVVY